MARIIVIEDDTHSARIADKLLRNAGHQVILAADGEGGMEAALSSQPDIILVDLGLPDIDGQTVVGLLRQMPDTEHTPIIAFTAWPEDTAHNMAEAYGCDGVIVKPIDTRRFAEQVSAFLKPAAPVDTPASADAPAPPAETPPADDRA
ncbi:MAG: response regulator [Anaerolineae bacterium]|jgi:two-component system cell cycle response regulator DivK|nr:response regulator [Anaerolineae bacterium]